MFTLFIILAAYYVYLTYYKKSKTPTWLNYALIGSGTLLSLSFIMSNLWWILLVIVITALYKNIKK